MGWCFVVAGSYELAPRLGSELYLKPWFFFEHDVLDNENEMVNKISKMLIMVFIFKSSFVLIVKILFLQIYYNFKNLCGLSMAIAEK